jgi:hypothetical protein
LALIGGPLLFASATATLFGLYEQLSVGGVIATIPVFLWKGSLNTYLIIKGSSPLRSHLRSPRR